MSDYNFKKFRDLLFSLKEQGKISGSESDDLLSEFNFNGEVLESLKKLDPSKAKLVIDAMQKFK
ncbi:hypothetical protein DHD05_18505 [Arenibacter sp. N53]|uniref:hypothetical protein n=1 Tax=Arenibacter TaxID=178469 RepID=UPI0004DF3C87|nr:MULTISPECIES: hypothetical protein [Arenibacter]MCM4153589.1 hypothetical protein [Arenibacter sp. N53]